ncbi:MAG: carboxypeptidase-like regulatory domain-containing protein [Bacteroidaceae bacterium]|nr:carboxypeptidase-like regulatory domain-containing protein [Bacteroidaceae bacterium]
MNKKLYLSAALCLQLFAAHAQQTVFRARVVDAETEEAMPYVNVYQKDGRGCVSNMEGDFTIMVDAGDSVRFSFVGYQTCSWKANEIPKVVKMQPATISMGDVTILSDIAILMNTYKTLQKEYQLHKEATSPFFNHVTLKNKAQTEMIEALLSAESAVNLRKPKLHAGQYWGLSAEGDTLPSLMEKMDMQNLMNIGLMMPDHPSRENTFTIPFPSKCSPSHLKRLYNISSVPMMHDARLIYRIQLEKKKPEKDRLLGGTLYVDAESFRPLQFEGDINMTFYVKREQGKIAIHERVKGLLKLHINYQSTKGFTEVANLSYNFSVNGLEVRSILFNVEDYGFTLGKPVPIRNNILAAIRWTSPNPQFFREQSIIQRTKEEEDIINQSAMETSLKNEDCDIQVPN